jgi:hypothetical protein
LLERGCRRIIRNLTKTILTSIHSIDIVFGT